MSDMHLASMWEIVSDERGSEPAVIQGHKVLSWRDYDEHAARLATAFANAGLTAQSKVGLFLYNCAEYLVGQYAAFKISGCPINVNYRYLDDELAYLLINSDSEAVIFHTSLGDRIERIRHQLPLVKLFVEVADDDHHFAFATPMSELIATHDPAPRTAHDPDDLYMLYTGGTTGMPKGAMQRIGALSSGMVSAFGLAGVAAPTTLAEMLPAVRHVVESGNSPRSVPCCPLMHGTGMWVGAMPALSAGGTVVLLEGRKFDAHELLETVEREAVTGIIIVGDPFARPIADALDERAAAGRPYDTSSVKIIVSSGAMWSLETKQRLLAHVDTMIYDALGSTEAGAMGAQIMTRAGAITQGGNTAKFQKDPGMKVIDENDVEVTPGSGVIGRVIKDVSDGCYGYYKDDVKTGATFLTLHGVPYVLSGDMASVEADGTLAFVGRGSQSINTMGEKVFPEEVEEAVKTHPAIDDCLVVGMPDDHFGQRVVAVASVHAGKVWPTPDEIIAHVKTKLSGFKAPKTVILVDAVRRAPNGKADYPWARETAAAR